MTELEINILKAARGDVVRLPYNSAQERASARLTEAGLLRFYFDEDCPTAEITVAGRIALRDH